MNQDIIWNIKINIICKSEFTDITDVIYFSENEEKLELKRNLYNNVGNNMRE